MEIYIGTISRYMNIQFMNIIMIYWSPPYDSGNTIKQTLFFQIFAPMTFIKSFFLDKRWLIIWKKSVFIV